MAKRIVVVPPRLLVDLFGVPESVSLPSRRGEEITFEAHGKRFHVKKITGTEYFLSCPLHSPRTRFGTGKEIAEDIGRVLECGILPQCKEKVC